jgi:uncharacterized peroxidase-related enzyme/YbgC/YbaW family acyl-CoA thioester hydrolase
VTAAFATESTTEYGHVDLVPVHFDDLDPIGMVHNGRYALLVERALARFWRQHGHTFRDGRPTTPDAFNVVQEFSISYRAPILGIGEVRVHFWLEHLGSSCAVYGYRLLSSDGATVYADGRRVMIKLDRETLRPSPWTPEVRAVAEGLQRRSVPAQPVDGAAAFLADPPETAAVTAAYEVDVTCDGYVNNSTRVWCWRPDLLASFQALRADVLAESGLSPREVAVIVAATAAARGDAYCALAWGSRLAELSDEATAARVLQGRDANLSDREAALADWCRQVVHDPNTRTRADVMRLRDTGFSDREIFEATAWTAFRMAFSTINAALGATPDPQLAEKAPRLVREAVTFGRPVGTSSGSARLLDARLTNGPTSQVLR